MIKRIKLLVVTMKKRFVSMFFMAMLALVVIACQPANVILNNHSRGWEIQRAAFRAGKSESTLTIGNPAWPIKASANHRYMVDQHNNPFLIVGDSPHSIVVNLSPSDMQTYMADRSGNGFNSLWVETLDNTYTGGRSDGSTYDGIIPFTTPGDFSTPNPNYFSRVDTVVNLAAQHNLIVFLDPVDTGGWISTIESNGQTKDYNYGFFLGNRYKNYTNIVWLNGNDFVTWPIDIDNADVKAIMQGIHDADPNHIQTIELNYPVSGSQDDTLLAPLLNLDAAYTYFPTYAEVLNEYNLGTMPVFMVEAHYDGENVGGELGTPNVLRRQEYWTMLSGATGQLYGTQYWNFHSGWQAGIDSEGMRELQYNTSLFRPRAWYNLIPDQNHILLTAGYGTFSSSGNVSDSDYATAAITSDKSFAAIYIPTQRSISVDMGQFRGAVTTRWYDPTNGTYRSINGSPFPNHGTVHFTSPANNSAGDHDWVLVFESSPLPITPTPTTGPAPTATPTPTPAILPAFIQVNSATPQNPQNVVAVPYASPQTLGNLNVVVIGWNDTVSNIISVTDSVGNTYHVGAVLFRGNGLSQAIYYAANIIRSPAGANTVTVTFNQAVSYPDIRILEYSGLDKTSPLDVSSSSTGTGPSTSSGSAVTTAHSELILGAGMTLVAFTSPGIGFTTRIITSPDADIVEDTIVNTTGTYSATAAQNTTGGWVMQMVTFKAAVQ